MASPGAADTNKSEKAAWGKTTPDKTEPEPAIMPQAKPEPKASSAKMPPGAKPSQNEINEAMQEPQIRNVKEILGGKVRHIERGKGGE